MHAGIDEESQQRLIQSADEAAPSQTAAGGSLTVVSEVPDRKDSLQRSDDSDSASFAAETAAINTLNLGDDQQGAPPTSRNGRSQGDTAQHQEDANLFRQSEDLDLDRDSGFWQSEDDTAPPSEVAAGPPRPEDLVASLSASLLRDKHYFERSTNLSHQHS